MVSSLHPKIQSSCSPNSQNRPVKATAMATRQVKQPPMICSARPLSPSPMAMAALGAPPWATSMVKALIRYTTGKHSPTPVRARAPTWGIWPM